MSKTKRNPYLTPAMHRCLLAMKEGDSGELVYSKGEVWVEDEKFSPATLKRLLHLTLLRNDSHHEIGSGYELYTLNEDGRRVLNDPTYVPRIARPNFGEPVRKARKKPIASRASKKGNKS